MSISSRGEFLFRCSGLLILASCSLFDSLASAEDVGQVPGRKLFMREWTPNTARSPGEGDGLGPQFNESSCVGCHNQGGPGGAGPSAKNVQLISAFRAEPITRTESLQHAAPASVPSSSPFGSSSQVKPSEAPAPVDDLFGDSPQPAKATPPALANASAPEIQDERELLAAIHPGFRQANSIVFHRFSTGPGYAEFRRKFGHSFHDQSGMGMPGMLGMSGMVGMSDRFGADQHEVLREPRLQTFLRTQASRIGNFILIASQRNTSALFGSGQIDAIPDSVLVAASQKKYNGWSQITGRVAKLKDGRIGRFGWKAQKASLRDFVFTACAVELGLHVPGEAQAGMPQFPAYEPRGFDLNELQCNALVAFVAKLPAPQVRTLADKSDLKFFKAGRERFDSIGCSVCHTPHLGPVANIYSDLLLHDMGQELSDSGVYGGSALRATDDDEANGPVPLFNTADRNRRPIDEMKLIGATRSEWRTPPLWGVRDSAPYMHDGRADTLEQAIALHGGEGSESAQKFFALTEPERLQVTLFLRSLIAPQNEPSVKPSPEKAQTQTTAAKP